VRVFAGEGDERTAHGAVGTQRVRFRGSGDAEVLFDFVRLREIEAEGRDRDRAGASGGVLEEISTRDCAHHRPPPAPLSRQATRPTRPAHGGSPEIPSAGSFFTNNNYPKKLP